MLQTASVAGRVFERRQIGGRPRGGDRFRPGVRSGHAEDLMSPGKQLGQEPRSDEAGGTREKDTRFERSVVVRTDMSG